MSCCFNMSCCDFKAPSITSHHTKKTQTHHVASFSSQISQSRLWILCVCGVWVFWGVKVIKKSWSKMKNFAHYNSRHRKSNLSPDRPGNLERINVPWTITTFFFCLIMNARICHGEIPAKMLREQVWGSDVRHRRWAHRLHILQGLKTNTFCSGLYWSSVVKVKLCKKAKPESL